MQNTAIYESPNLGTIRLVEDAKTEQGVKIFNSPDFGEIRTAGSADNPLFCLADVCRVLDLQAGATKNRLSQKGINSINTLTNGGHQEMIYINEQNLYKVIMRSDKPQAEPFQNWVCGEVLPTIRNTAIHESPDLGAISLLETTKENDRVSQTELLKNTEICGKQFNVYGTPENPLFKAQDIAEVIEHSNSRVLLEQVDEDEKGVRIVYTPGGNQQVWFLTEDGLYEVLMQSRKPIAKKFKKEVKAILKEIRTKGGYIAASTEMTDAEIMAKALLIGQETIKRKDERIKELQSLNIRQQGIIDGMKKDSDYLKLILQSPSTVTTTQIAQDYGMSAKAFNMLLHQMKIQHKVNGQWILYAPHQAKGYVHSFTFNITHADGSTSVKMQTEWTQRGRIFLYDALKEACIIPMVEKEPLCHFN